MPDNFSTHPAKEALSLRAFEGGLADVYAKYNLYVDDDGRIRDWQIELMFDDLFHGKALDSVFRNNFDQYYRYLTGSTVAVPSDVYDNVISMRAFVTENFGPVLYTPPNPATIADDPDLAHCTVRAVFIEPKRHDIDACYAPSELYAGLLCVVTVLRQLAQKFNDDRYVAKPGELN